MAQGVRKRRATTKRKVEITLKAIFSERRRMPGNTHPDLFLCNHRVFKDTKGNISNIATQFAVAYEVSGLPVDLN